MYLSHYNLKLKPFQISTDPRFLWLGENHKEAFAVLKYGILDNRGFLLLTGDVGTGKTTLINALVNSLGDDVVTATVPDPSLEKIDFFNYISKAFGIKGKFLSKGEFISKFRTFLCDVYENQKRSLLIIDESQLLDNGLLEEIRLLSNIEKQSTKLLNIFFVGQNEFNDLLWEDRNRALRQRITVNYNVYALSDEETGDYIRHRLKIAGTKQTVFSEGAIQEIVAYSGGFPRMINIICDHALLSGFVKGVDKIDESIIRECTKDLRIPRSERAAKNDAFQIGDTTEAPQKPADIQEKSKKRAGFYTFAAGCVVISLCIAGYFFNPGIIQGFHDKVAGLWLQVKTQYNQSSVTIPKEKDQTGEYPKRGVAFHSKTAQEKTEKGSSEISGLNRKLPGNSSIIESDIKESNIDDLDPEKGSNTISGQIKPQDNAINQTNQLSTRIDKIEGFSSTITNGNALSFKYISKEDRSIIALLRGKVSINFSHNSNEVSDDAVKILGKIADVLIKYPKLKIGVIGYTDSSGIYSYNKSLSRFRANIVKSYLTGKGAMPEQITAIGMGPQNPVKTNSTWQGRKSNRRVEIVLYEEKE